jgi:hypothetical protein
MAFPPDFSYGYPPRTSPRRRKFFTVLAWPLLAVPQFLFWLGALLNQIAIVVNGGVMPVQWYSGNPWDADKMHVVMTSDTHLKLLCDWINLHTAILSPGDVLLSLGDLAIGPCFWAWISYIVYRAFRDEIALF